MSDKLVAIILDAQDVDIMREFEMENLKNLYYKNGQIFIPSTYPHTCTSYNQSFSGERGDKIFKFWIHSDNTAWQDPAVFFDRDKKEAVKGAELWKREDYDLTYIWDVAEHNSLKSEVIQLPISLPPFNHNSHFNTEAWFPDTPRRQEKCMIEKGKAIMEAVKDGENDLVVSSMPFPDKVGHALGEQKYKNRNFWRSQEEGVEWARKLLTNYDRWIGEVADYCNENGIKFVMFGDHGSPAPGAIKVPDYKLSLPRHRVHSMIVSNIDSELPEYTDEMFDFLLDQLGLDYSGEEIPQVGETQDPGQEEEVKERLENLGYL